MGKIKNRKRVQLLKIIALICFVVLLCEVVYIAYNYFSNKGHSIYFESINALVVDNEGYYVGVGSNNDNDNHYEKAKIAMFNSKKEKVFEKLYNVGYNSAFFGVVADGDNYIAVGSYEKDEDDHNDSVRKALIVKYDKDGNEIFSSDFQILDNSKFTSVVKVGEDYLVTGQSIYKNTKVGNKVGGAILAKYNKDGDLIWSKTYGSNKSSIFNDLLVVNDSIYAVGTDDNYLGIIVRFDMDGNYIKHNDYKVTDSLGFSGITNIGNVIYISGALRRNDNDTDAMIVRYNLDCVYIDQTVYTGSGKERFNKLIVDNDENIIAIGTMATAKKQSGVSEYNYDGIIAKYDEELKAIDDVVYGDERDDYFTDIVPYDNEYLISGYSSYEDGSYMSKFIRYSKALKVLGVE